MNVLTFLVIVIQMLTLEHRFELQYFLKLELRIKVISYALLTVDGRTNINIEKL